MNKQTYKVFFYKTGRVVEMIDDSKVFAKKASFTK
jgi:hypothetical protein